MDDPIRRMIDQQVVFDTGTPIVYVGTLREVTEREFVIEQADIHDCRDGHASQEQYLADAREDGVTVNRRRVVVMRTTVISVSLLTDVVDR